MYWNIKTKTLMCVCVCVDLPAKLAQKKNCFPVVNHIISVHQSHSVSTVLNQMGALLYTDIKYSFFTWVKWLKTIITFLIKHFNNSHGKSITVTKKITILTILNTLNEETCDYNGLERMTFGKRGKIECSKKIPYNTNEEEGRGRQSRGSDAP